MCDLIELFSTNSTWKINYFLNVILSAALETLSSLITASDLTLHCGSWCKGICQRCLASQCLRHRCGWVLSLCRRLHFPLRTKNAATLTILKWWGHLLCSVLPLTQWGTQSPFNFTESQGMTCRHTASKETHSSTCLIDLKPFKATNLSGAWTYITVLIRVRYNKQNNEISWFITNSDEFNNKKL